jgi:alpha-mannosidase/mannosylglycerate hydrolase
MAADLQAFLSDEARHTQVDPLLIFDGGDHLAWDADSYALIANRIREPGDSLLFVHSSLDDYQAEVLAQEQRITASVEGELREPGLYPSTRDQQEVIPGVLSSRVWIKQENAACQAALCQWAEPLDVLTSALLSHPGHDRGFLNTAWKWLLQNHPHDSICGCSIDYVHEDMRYRFAQSRQIAVRLTQDKMRRIALAIEGELGSQELRVVVFNPLPQPFDQPAEITLDFPPEWPRALDWFSPESLPVFRLYDAEGHEIEYQRLSVHPNHTRLERFDQYLPKARKVTSVSISLPLTIPSMGYTSLFIRPETEEVQSRFPMKALLKLDDRTIANETLRVEVEPDGSLALTDLCTGQVYPHLMSFEDGADIGNGYNFRSPASDQVYSSTHTQIEVASLHDGPHMATLRVRRCMRLPAEFDFRTMQRSSRMVDVTIDSLITLRAGVDTLEVETTIHNTAKDHRMRVIFPSGASNVATYLTDTPFDVVERPIAPPSAAHPSREADPLTRPQQSWAAVFDDTGGLAVVAPGQMEVMVQDLPGKPVALTLFRSTGNTIYTDGEPGGQLLDPLTFRYSLSPVRGAPDRAALCLLGQRLIAGLKYVQLSSVDLDNSRASRQLPPSLEFLKVTGQVVVTSVRQVESDWEVRLFNPNTEAVSAALTLLKDLPSWDAPGYAQLVDLEHRPITKKHRIQNRTMEYRVDPKKILTVRFSISNKKDDGAWPRSSDQ